MCPPYVPTPEETRRVLARYEWALLVQRAIPLSQAAVDEAFAGESLAAGKARSDAGQRLGAQSSYEQTLRASRNEFAALMTGLEREAFALGYRFAAAFSGGECGLCELCVAGGSGAPCRHPFAARPSMEAVGIDVLATAAAAGLLLDLSGASTAYWNGLLLVD
jgi:predicted metal-binding protein